MQPASLLKEVTQKEKKGARGGRAGGGRGEEGGARGRKLPKKLRVWWTAERRVSRGSRSVRAVRPLLFWAIPDPVAQDVDLGVLSRFLCLFGRYAALRQ